MSVSSYAILFKLLFIFTALLASNPVFSQNPPSIQHEITGDIKPWTSEIPHYGGHEFHFIVMTDNAGGLRRGVYQEAIEKAETLHPSFVISIGDLINGSGANAEEPYKELNAEWDEFMTWIEPLSAPYFFVPGNHDVRQAIRKEVWNQRFGPNYYYFKYMDVLFVVLDSTNYDQEQFDWLKKTFAEQTGVRWTFVLQHHPLWLADEQQRIENQWETVWDIIKGREKLTVFGGHIHKYFHSKRDNIHFITMATTGGGADLRGPDFGEFDHMMWVTVTEPQPKMINITLDGLLPYDFRSGEMSAAFHEYTQDKIISAEPLLIQDSHFSEGSWTVSVRNPWIQPLRFKATVEAQEEVSVFPRDLSFFVPPHQTVSKTIKLTASEPMPVYQLQTVSIHWEGFYDKQNQAPNHFKDVYRLQHSAMNQSKKISTIEVDGDLSDWQELRYNVSNPADIIRNEEAWRGKEDCYFSFDIAHNDEWIYAAVTVIDDEIQVDENGQNDEYARIRIRPSGETGGKPYSFILRHPSNSDREEKVEYHTASRKDGNKMIYELAIQRSTLESDSSMSSKTLQINVEVDDRDTADERFGRSNLTWKPVWSSNNTEQENPKFGIFHLE